MIFHVYYPSGRTFDVEGVAVAEMSHEEHGLIPMVYASMDKEAPITVLDPRGVVVAEDGEVMWEPRSRMARLAPAWREWLEEHVDWPATLEFTGHVR